MRQFGSFDIPNASTWPKIGYLCGAQLKRCLMLGIMDTWRSINQPYCRLANDQIRHESNYFETSSCITVIAFLYFLTITKEGDWRNMLTSEHPSSQFSNIQTRSKTPSSCAFHIQPIQAKRTHRQPTVWDVQKATGGASKGKYSQSNSLKQSRGSSDANVTGRTFLIEQRRDERGKSLSSKDQCAKRRGTLVRDGSSELYKSGNSISLHAQQVNIESWRMGHLNTRRDERRAIDSSSVFRFLTLPEFRVLNREMSTFFLSRNGKIPCRRSLLFAMFVQRGVRRRWRRIRAQRLFREQLHWDEQKGNSLLVETWSVILKCFLTDLMGGVMGWDL